MLFLGEQRSSERARHLSVCRNYLGIRLKFKYIPMDGWPSDANLAGETQTSMQWVPMRGASQLSAPNRRHAAPESAQLS